MTPKNAEESELRFAAVVTSLPSSLSDADLNREEEDAIKTLLRRAPVSERNEIREILRMNGMPTGASDPDMARQLSRIASVRVARAQRLKAASQEQYVLDEERLAKMVRVRVALVEHLPEEDSLAVVLRSPSDNGIPVVLLARDSATDHDLALALGAATGSLERQGASVTQSSATPLRRGSDRQSAIGSLPATWARWIDHLRALPEDALPGVGAARFTDVLVPRSPE
jgi:hypothetical protein